MAPQEKPDLPPRKDSVKEGPCKPSLVWKKLKEGGE